MFALTRYVTTATIGEKFYTVVWTWRANARRIIYTDKELENMQMHGQDKSDWKSAAAMSDKEIEAAVAEDDDEAGMHIDWSNNFGRTSSPQGSAEHAY